MNYFKLRNYFEKGRVCMGYYWAIVNKNAVLGIYVLVHEGGSSRVKTIQANILVLMLV